MADGGSGHEATEEDATELQFPKGAGGAGACRRCGASLPEPHVACGACPGRPALCLACFARGAEFPGHASSHPYSLVGRCCPLGEGWGAARSWRAGGHRGVWPGELAGRQCPRGGARPLGVPRPLPAPLPAPPAPRAGGPGAPAQRQGGGRRPSPWRRPHRVRGRHGEPPRPLPGTPAAVSLAGYCAARGDFEVEADPTAEAALAELEPELFEGAGAECPGVALVEAVADAYRRRVAERHRLRRVVRDAGLLVGAGRMAATLGRLRPSLPPGLARALPRLGALLPPRELEEVVAGLVVECELQQHVQLLREYRQAGLTRQAGVATYEALRRRREAAQRERECLVAGGAGQGGEWKVVGRGILSRGVLPGAGRRARPPMDVSGLPGYEELTQQEREACAELHMAPEAFLHHKHFLVGEARRGGGLRLAQARTLLKIDVNKTRRIFDVLREAGDIHAITVPTIARASLARLPRDAAPAPAAATTTTTETPPS
ncbi:LOW QUALITY PROTEIN: transcriptional adapter 2-alpha-like [Scylla paramamosain]|uniref:LOW QUALITY PROTEIN: transcriptional adapter 2-alpha-like n=1 Tax=Scylla paramamosain TaxID=85552 RepID=UPI003083949B